jgi:hypothetical protein
MSERSQRLRHTPIHPGVTTIRARLRSKHRSDHATHVDADSGRSLLTDEVISAVHQHALEICEQQLLTSRGRLSDEQAHITRTVIEAIVDRLLAVPAARMNAASEARDYAELLVRLFEPEPFLSD